MSWSPVSEASGDIRMFEPSPGRLLRPSSTEHEGVETSGDGGATWSPLPYGPHAGLPAWGFFLDDTLAAYSRGLDTLYLYHPPTGVSTAELVDLELYPRQLRMRHGVLVAETGSRRGAYSLDRGRTWRDAESPTSDMAYSLVRSLAVAPGGYMLLALRGEPTEVGDGTVPFVQIAAPAPYQHCVDVYPVGARYLAPRVGAGLPRSVVDLSGREYARVPANVYGVANAEYAGESVQLASGGVAPRAGLLRSADGFVTADTADLDVDDFSLTCKGPRCGFVTLEDSIYLSLDAGRHWVNKSAEWGETVGGAPSPFLLLDDGVCYVSDAGVGPDNELVCVDDDGSNRRVLTSRRYDHLLGITRIDDSAWGVCLSASLGFEVDSAGSQLREFAMRGFPTSQRRNNRYATARSVVRRGDSLIAFGAAAVPYVSPDRGDTWAPWAGDLPPGHVYSGRTFGDGIVLATSTGVYYSGAGTSSTSRPVGAVGPALRLSPNPVGGGQWVRLSGVAGDEAPDILFVDAAGRAVASRAEGAAGRFRVRAPAGRGIYVALVGASGGEVVARRLVVE